MCYRIDAEVVLIHRLRNKEFCTFEDLFENKTKIERSFSNVFIDISRSSILNFILTYPKYFKIVDSKITKLDAAQDFFTESVISYFDSKIDNSVRSKIQPLLESA